MKLKQNFKIFFPQIHSSFYSFFYSHFLYKNTKIFCSNLSLPKLKLSKAIKLEFVIKQCSLHTVLLFSAICYILLDVQFL